ncbi:hypothetical protein K469DRAFT_693545 [Zopfia rhizophila CBS 207.26]|uniref:NACHT-NTPase and P-loop NTPases N-terminal domain-containing protein n=1 Tax=Zopfia rhizophila CBS 207.26 TaxID=1314779 RepID=A0A6A6DKT7_9PEZI|nr:hypothetical protein K469DRAFT_693545 [Zopfia rhizophila CBS 207.26]
MGFGCGIGDIFAILQMAIKLRERFIDASVQLHDISKEIRSFSIIFEIIKVNPNRTQLVVGHEKKLAEILVGCNALDTLNEILNRYEELDGGSKDGDPLYHTTVISRSIDRLHERYEDRERREMLQDILACLDAVDYDPQQHGIISW